MKKICRKVLRILSRFVSYVLIATLFVSFAPLQLAGAEPMPSALDDIKIIKERLVEYFLDFDTIDDGAYVERCYVSEAETYLASQNPDGSWDDVDYYSTQNAANGRPWDPYLALDRMQAMAIAYHHPEHNLYQDDTLLLGVENALNHWSSINGHPTNQDFEGPYANNFWENGIGVQLRFARIGLFLEDDLSDDAMGVILRKLQKEREGSWTTGQNALWYSQNAVYRALLTEDAQQLEKTIVQYLSICLDYQKDGRLKEAVQVDNSFFMHGAQFYSNGYGMSMFRDMSFWIFILRDTQFAIAQNVLDLMANYMLSGTRWTIRGDLLEVYHGYRPNKKDAGYPNYAYEYVAPLERMMAADTARSDEYKKIRDNIIGEQKSNGLNGNYYMWRSAYMSHMRDDYGVNVKMDSSTIIGGEWRASWSGTNYGNLIYWTSAAANTVVVDGNEYMEIYPSFDWAHVPGTTAPAAIANANYLLQSNSVRTAAVSNGEYGATAYDLNKWGTQGKKGYFFFEDEYVALGAGIESTRSEEIHTTLNQSVAKNVVAGGVSVPTGVNAQEYYTNWLHNDQIGYVFLENTDVYVSNQQQYGLPSLWDVKDQKDSPETFTAYLNHGTKPTNASYAYIIYPAKTAAQTKTYAENIEIKVISNTTDIQAVRHDGLNLTQINFYEAGELEYRSGKSISVDYPCVVMLDESGSDVKITLAVTDASPSKIINVSLKRDNGQSTTTTFVSQEIPYAGKPMERTEGANDKINASSFVAPHFPYLAKVDDGTYWKSEPTNDEWISYMVGDGTLNKIKDMTIHWGDAYATHYKVQISQDGKSWVDVKEITNGTGDIETVPINDYARYIRVLGIQSATSGYEIQTITENYTSNVAQDKKVIASSYYANDVRPENVVDGLMSSRWASSRQGSEWIYVDLKDYYEIETIRLFWEGAYCSEFKLEVSNDAVNWTQAYHTTTNSFPGSAAERKNVVDFESGIIGRYVRMLGIKPATQYGSSLWEFEVYGTPTDNPDPGNLISIQDEFDDFSKIYDRTANWGIELVSNAEGRDDTFLLKRTSNSKESLVYNVEGLSGFKLAVYQSNDSGTGKGIFTFEASETGRGGWKTVTPTKKNPNGVSGKFYLETYELNRIPVDTNFLRITLETPSGSKDWAPQLSYLELFYPEDIPVALSEIRLDNANPRIEKGKDRQLIYSVFPSNVSETLIWETGDDRIATVTDGLVRALHTGDVSITIANASGKVSATCSLTVTPENIATSGTASASSENGGNVAQNAIDADLTTRWATFYYNNPNVASSFFQVDLGAPTQISGVEIIWETAFGKEYKIQVSDTGASGSWIDIDHITNGTQHTYLDFEEIITTQYVRMQGIVPTGNYGYSIYEFMIFGAKDDPLAPYQTIVEEFDDFSKIYDRTPEWGLEPITFGAEGRDDTSLLKRIKNTKQSLVYYVEELKSFTLNAYKSNERSSNPDDRGDITFEVSATGLEDSWESVAFASESPKGTDSKFYPVIYTANSLPTGTNYLRINVDGGSVAWAPQLSSLEMSYPGDTDSQIEEIRLEDTHLSIEIDKEVTLIPSIFPLNATESVQWFSSNPDILAVSQSGKLSPKAPGNATIIIKNGDSSLTAQIEVTVMPLNVAIGKEAKASNTNGNNIPGNAVDGDSSTRWASLYRDINPSIVNKYWFQVDLGRIYDLSAIHIEWENAYGKEYYIQLSDSGEEGSWTNAKHITNGTIYSAIELDEGASGQFVRMQGIECATSYGYSIYEFKVYGTPADTKPVDKDELKQLIDENKDRNEADYTPESWLGFKTALDDAIAVRDNDDATQEEVTEALEALEMAVSRLEDAVSPIPVDKDELKQLIDKNKDRNEADYTPESWLGFKTALNDAIAVRDNDDATQEEITEALEVLEMAVSGLEDAVSPIPVDKDELKQLIDKNKDRNEADYTPESWLGFKTALDNAIAVRDNDNATQKEVTEAGKALEDAAKQLIEKPDDSYESDNDSNGGTLTPKTGNDITPIFVFGMIAVLALVAGLKLIQLKQKEN